MKHVLVTGGAGFIGSNFVRHLLASEPEVRVVTLDLLTYAGRLENLENLPNPQQHRFIHGNICDRPLVNAILAEEAIDTIVHFAAESHVDRSISGPMPFIETNIVGTFTLLEAARNAWAEKSGPFRFHHVSTDEVFGALQPGDAPFSEKTAYDPHSPYSASKASSDHLVRAYGTTYHLPVTISNCSNNYGPYQFPEKLIPLMILNGMMQKPLPVYGQGAQVRDWLHVEDHCEAILRILKQGRDGETYCIGGDNQPSNLEIVRTICDLLDQKLPLANGQPHQSLIRFVTDRPGHDFRYDIDTAKIEQELGWKPKHNLQQGLSETIDWYLSNTAWLQSVMQKEEFNAWLEQNYQQR
ncbi:dTDP-glucose 4,6-dehydratase [Flexilinea flocculi]|uniref:dTDP-glucose 4,6-dehydratase n=1 Tax=Flexilinea flocculi TaxID=1678840 RepID=A0A0K8PA17_9CHLR|nr:dTDP-glucose 4,6-dehydratase [Flexilinea flocculi]GAP39481.1 dTDP-glucose 4,6-dehydratase [Flexilinea flocculi]